MSTKKPAAKKAASKRTSTAHVMADLASAVRDLKNPTMVSSEPMVGIRNISSLTIGLLSPFPASEADVQLHGPRYYEQDPKRMIPDGNMVAQISHKWWQQLRRQSFVRKGMIVRDDSILSAGVPRAPEDPEDAIHPEAKINAIHDPFEWIESKDEKQLTAAVNALTSEASVRRILAAVNQAIEAERVKMNLPVEGSTADDEGMNNEETALQNVSWRYKKAEEIALIKLERMLVPKTD